MDRGCDRAMAEALQSCSIDKLVTKRLSHNGSTDLDEERDEVKKERGPAPASAAKRPCVVDPDEALASARHEFGEYGGVNMSIESSVTFTVMEADTMKKTFTGELGHDQGFYVYSRHFNPTVLNLSTQLAAMEGTEAAYCTSSGMSAISSVLLHLCSTGSHIVASRILYAETHTLLTHFLSRIMGLRVTLVDVNDEEEVRDAVREGETQLILAESMSNPTMVVTDIPKLSAVAREKGVMLVIDNTMTPMVVSPARLGADVVVHSITKFISGGADIMAGVICGPASMINSMMNFQGGALIMLGPMMSPKEAYEISARLPHLGLRMKEHCARALLFATRIKKLGLNVIYPGLEDHPHHSLLRSIANPGYGFGAVVCIDMGNEERGNRLLYHLQNTSQFGLIALSLGYYETLMSCSGSVTSSKFNEKHKKLTGISSGLVRLSIGYNGSAEQRWAQFEKALTACDNGAEEPTPLLSGGTN